MTATGGPARHALAARQGAVVAALVAGGPAPAGFEDGRLDATVAVLRHKRRREVASRLPETVRALGPRFDDLFARHADRHPPRGDSRADAVAFVRARRVRRLLDRWAAEEVAEQTLHLGRRPAVVVVGHDCVVVAARRGDRIVRRRIGPVLR